MEILRRVALLVTLATGAPVAAQPHAAELVVVPMPNSIPLSHSDDQGLLESVDRAIATLIRSGEHERIARKYFPFNIL